MQRGRTSKVDTSYKNYVRGVEVDFSPKAIMKALDLKAVSFDKASYHEKMNGDLKCDEIASDICVVRADWVSDERIIYTLFGIVFSIFLVESSYF